MRSVQIRIICYCASILIALSLLPKLGVAQADPLRLLWRNEAISGITAHAFSHSGKILALANDHEVHLWDMGSSEFVRTIPIPKHSYDQMAFTPDDRELVLLSPSFPGKPRWNPEAPEPSPGFEIRVDLNSNGAHSVNNALLERGKWSLSHDGTLIAVINDSGALAVHRSKDFSIVSVKQLPPIRPSYLATMYEGWIPRNGVWFTWDNNGLIALRGGDAFIFNSELNKEEMVIDSVGKWKDPTVGPQSIYIARDRAPSELLTAPQLSVAKLQPPAIIIPTTKDWNNFQGPIKEPESALLFGNGDDLISRYPLWRGMLYDYGTPPGEDTLVFTTKRSGTRWGIKVNRFMQVLGITPNNPKELLLGDGATFLILNVDTHSITYLTLQAKAMGFDKNGVNLLDTAQGGLFAFDGATWKRIGNANGAPSQRASDEPFLKDYLRVVPAWEHKDLAFMDFWSKNDFAHIFDLQSGVSLVDFPGGLNQGINAGAISSDYRWVATVSSQGTGRLWRASDGALISCFNASQAEQAAFPTNDRFLLYAAVYGNDSGISVLDLKTDMRTRVAVGNSVVSMFEFNADCSRLVVYRYHRTPWNGMGPAITEMYSTPSSWRRNDTSFNPKTVYLPLRFYIPKDAAQARDTNGKPFSPPRTCVELELRYANNTLLKKILDGNYNVGQWAEWIYDMTSYPKGAYIMHTEIGGVINDEKLELR